MIRHAVVFVLKDDTTPEQVLRAKEGMAACYFASKVLALDFGDDLGIGEPTNHDLGLTHDHVDRELWDDYNKNETHHRAGEYIKTITNTDRVARVDWVYDGPESRRGLVRHMAMYRWADGIDEAGKAEARAATLALGSAVPGLRWIGVGDDLLWYPPNHDWIVEAHFDDADGFRAFREHPAQVRAAELIAAATKPPETATIQHRMLSG
jgi:hypothetical protein